MSHLIAREATIADIAEIVERMRPVDAEEQLASGFDATREGLFKRLVDAQAIAIRQIALAGADYRPVALVGAYQTAPGVAGVHQVATDRWPEIGRAAFAFYRRVFIPQIIAPHARLAECRIMEGHDLARRWIRRLGFTENGRPLPYGRQGERFVHCVWVNPTQPGES